MDGVGTELGLGLEEGVGADVARLETFGKLTLWQEEAMDVTHQLTAVGRTLDTLGESQVVIAEYGVDDGLQDHETAFGVIEAILGEQFVSGAGLAELGGEGGDLEGHELPNRGVHGYAHRFGSLDDHGATELQRGISVHPRVGDVKATQSATEIMEFLVGRREHLIHGDGTDQGLGQNHQMAHTTSVVPQRESGFSEGMEHHEFTAVVDDHMGHLLGLAPEHVAVVGTPHRIHDLTRTEDIRELVGLGGLREIRGLQRNRRTEELRLRAWESELVRLPDGLVVLKLFGDLREIVEFAYRLGKRHG